MVYISTIYGTKFLALGDLGLKEWFQGNTIHKDIVRLIVQLSEIQNAVPYDQSYLTRPQCYIKIYVKNHIWKHKKIYLYRAPNRWPPILTFGKDWNKKSQRENDFSSDLSLNPNGTAPFDWSWYEVMWVRRWTCDPSPDTMRKRQKTPKSKFHCTKSLVCRRIIAAWAEVKVFEARGVPLRSASSLRGIRGGIGTQDSSRLGISSGRHVNEAVPTTVHAHSCSLVKPRVSGHHL